MGINTKITATSARELTNNSEHLINVILKNIKDEASFGRNVLYFDNPCTSQESITRVIEEISNLGFKIEHYCTTKDESSYNVHNYEQNETLVTFVIRW